MKKYFYYIVLPLFVFCLAPTDVSALVLTETQINRIDNATKDNKCVGDIIKKGYTGGGDGTGGGTPHPTFGTGPWDRWDDLVESTSTMQKLSNLDTHGEDYNTTWFGDSYDTVPAANEYAKIVNIPMDDLDTVNDSYGAYPLDSHLSNSDWHVPGQYNEILRCYKWKITEVISETEVEKPTQPTTPLSSPYEPVDTPVVVYAEVVDRGPAGKNVFDVSAKVKADLFGYTIKISGNRLRLVNEEGGASNPISDKANFELIKKDTSDPDPDIDDGNNDPIDDGDGATKPVDLDVIRDIDFSNEQKEIIRFLIAFGFINDPDLVEVLEDILGEDDEVEEDIDDESDEEEDADEEEVNDNLLGDEEDDEVDIIDDGDDMDGDDSVDPSDNDDNNVTNVGNLSGVVSTVTSPIQGETWLSDATYPITARNTDWTYGDMHMYIYYYDSAGNEIGNYLVRVLRDVPQNGVLSTNYYVSDYFISSVGAQKYAKIRLANSDNSVWVESNGYYTIGGRQKTSATPTKKSTDDRFSRDGLVKGDYVTITPTVAEIINLLDSLGLR